MKKVTKKLTALILGLAMSLTLLCGCEAEATGFLRIRRQLSPSEANSLPISRLPRISITALRGTISSREHTG